MQQGWVKAVSVEELRRKGRTVFRLDGRQVALFDTANGIRACNNRCPHEGYPLREGTLDGNCLLTCNWHNWKFDLETGENQRDGDRLRVYPVEIRGGEVWIEIVDPPVRERLAKSLEDLKQGFRDHDYERLAREIARIARLGVDPAIAVKEAIRWSYDRMEFGWTHAYAGTADWLALHDSHADEPENRLICLLESIGHMADDTLRERRYPYAEGIEDWDEDAFCQAVEEEDEARAIRLTRGAVATGDAWGAMERGLSRAALAHYAGFGHSAIYVTQGGRADPAAGRGYRRAGPAFARARAGVGVPRGPDSRVPRLWRGSGKFRIEAQRDSARGRGLRDADRQQGACVHRRTRRCSRARPVP